MYSPFEANEQCRYLLLTSWQTLAESTYESLRSLSMQNHTVPRARVEAVLQGQIPT